VAESRRLENLYEDVFRQDMAKLEVAPQAAKSDY
jgi:hypothetical protein